MGRFIVIEGLDGAGTTTQAERLCASLTARGVEVVRTAEPTTGPIGRMIRAVLRGEPDAPSKASLPWLFAADRADHLARLVEPGVARGAWVVSDRYLPSSLAYQSLDHPLEQIVALNATFRAPDLLIMVDIDVDTALDRITARGAAREIFEERAALAAIAARYAEVMPTLVARGWRVVHIDGALAIDDVAAQIGAAVDALDA